MRTLIPTFPRQLATPRRTLIHSESAFYERLNKYNGFKNCYYSLYAVDENGTFNNSHIDKIAFDFDGENAQKHVKKLSNHLIKEDLIHTILFSGKKGFHLYILTTNGESLKFPKGALTNAHKYFDNLLNIENDFHIVGDIARILRIPNTKHLGSNLYCLPISRYDLDKSFKEIKEKAKKQSFKVFWYGSKLLDMKPFDNERPQVREMEIPDHKYVVTVDDKLVKKFHPCIQRMLIEPSLYCKNKSRYIFALYCKVKGLPPKLCEDIARKYWKGVKENGGNRSKFKEFQDEKQIEYAYRTDKPIPNCEKMYEIGICPGRCESYIKNNFPLYKK